MTDKIKCQILAIRDTGVTNMLDIPKVRHVALLMEFDELVEYLDQNRKAYATFILYGDEA